MSIFRFNLIDRSYSLSAGNNGKCAYNIKW